MERLTKEAGDLESEVLPTFETEWWNEASTKPWAAIYPQIAQHTYFAVLQPCIKARNTAIAYAVTQDESLSSIVQRVLLHYAGYDFFAEHPDVGMNWSIWCLSLLQAYDLVRDTVCPDGGGRIDAFFDSALAAVRKNDEWWLRDNMGGLFNNHFAWHKIFIGSCGIFYNRPDMIEYAVEGNQGFRELIENGIRDDGLWFESSLNYHFAALVPLVEMASELSNSGTRIDLWNRTFANGRRLRDLVAGALDAYLSVVSNRLNEVMKRLTVLAVLALPLNFLTGFFGMNFFASGYEVRAPLGGPMLLAASCALMVLTPLALALWLRRKGWF